MINARFYENFRMSYDQSQKVHLNNVYLLAFKVDLWLNHAITPKYFLRVIFGVTFCFDAILDLLSLKDGEK